MAHAQAACSPTRPRTVPKCRGHCDECNLVWTQAGHNNIRGACRAAAPRCGGRVRLRSRPPRTEEASFDRSHGTPRTLANHTMSDTPVPPTPGPDTPFEIGLVMAGTVSAGAYTAGVVDFLIEALDEWEKAKQFAREHPNDPKARECPMHEVRIKVMVGASAGGMTAGLAAGILGMNYQSVTAQPAPDRPANPLNNNLYRSWVNTIDIDPLLGANDLADDRSLPVQSVLDSSSPRDMPKRLRI